METLKYAIYPPRFAGSTVYYKDLIVMVLENDKLIGAYKYDFSGNKIPISTDDLEFNTAKPQTHYASIQNPSANVLESTIRTLWIFDDEKSAYLQKLILLEHIRNYFYQKQVEERENFDTKIPPEISSIVELHRSQNPEYFL